MLKNANCAVLWCLGKGLEIALFVEIKLYQLLFLSWFWRWLVRKVLYLCRYRGVADIGNAIKPKVNDYILRKL